MSFKKWQTRNWFSHHHRAWLFLQFIDRKMAQQWSSPKLARTVWIFPISKCTKSRLKFPNISRWKRNKGKRDQTTQSHSFGAVLKYFRKMKHRRVSPQTCRVLPFDYVSVQKLLGWNVRAISTRAVRTEKLRRRLESPWRFFHYVRRVWNDRTMNISIGLLVFPERRVIWRTLL